MVHLAHVAGLDDAGPPGCAVFSRMRWWWTAEVSSSDGIGARSRPESRSDSTTNRAPAAIACDTSTKISSSRACIAVGAAGDVVEPADDVGRVPGQVAVGVDVDDLGQLVVVDAPGTAGRPGGRAPENLEGVALGTDDRAERGDQLLADRVERRVGDLGEELGEVVEDQPRPVGQHGDGRVGAHRAERLSPGAGHRRQQDLELLLRVAEGLLATGHRRRGVDDVLALAAGPRGG